MWEITTYGGGEFLRLIFNGVAALTATDDFLGALRVMAMVALLWVLLEAVFATRPLNYAWLFALALAYMTLLLPRTDVIINDRVDPMNTAVVSNVPLGVAVFAGFTSRLGDWLTRSFESVFSLPNNLNYSQSGALFAHHLIQSSTKFRITDARLAENMSQFWRQCVFYDLLLGLYTLDDLRDSDDIQGFIAANTSVARRFTYNAASGQRDLLLCRAGWRGAMRNDLRAELTVAERYFGRRLVRARTAADAVARFSASLPVAYQFITGISRNSEQIITQQALANAAERGLVDFAVAANAPAAAQSFTLARAQRERRVTFVALGELASRTLPLLRGLIEGMLYGLFPIVCLLLMLPVASQALISYLKALAWIQLWPPLYALLNLAATLYAQMPAQSALTLPGGNVALTLANVSALGDAMAELSAMAGYLSLSIPLISYLILNSAGAVAASIASGITQSYESPVSRASEEASTGNIALANAHVGNKGWWQSQTAPSSRSDYVQSTGASGVTHTMGAGGMETATIPATSTPVRVDWNQAVSQSVSERASSELQSAIGSSNEWSQRSEAFSNTLRQLSQSLRRESGASSSIGSSESDSLKRDVATVEKVLDTMGKEFKLDRSESLAAAIGVNAGSKGSLFGLSGEGKGKVEVRDSDSYRDALNYASESGVRTSIDRVLSHASSEQLSHSTAHGEGATALSGAGRNEMVAMGERAQASLGRAHAWQQLQQQTEQSQAGSNEDLSARLYGALAAEHGTDKASRLLQVHHGSVPGAGAEERAQAAEIITAAADQLVGSLVSERMAGMEGQQALQQGASWQQQVRQQGEQEMNAALERQSPEGQGLSPPQLDDAETSAVQQQLQQAGQRIQETRQQEIAPERGAGLQRAMEDQQQHLQQQMQEQKSGSWFSRLFK